MQQEDLDFFDDGDNIVDELYELHRNQSINNRNKLIDTEIKDLLKIVNELGNLEKKTMFECSICFDSGSLNVVNLPCCGTDICDNCFNNTLKVSVKCSYCRKNVSDSIRNLNNKIIENLKKDNDGLDNIISKIFDDDENEGLDNSRLNDDTQSGMLALFNNMYNYSDGIGVGASAGASGIGGASGVGGASGIDGIDEIDKNIINIITVKKCKSIIKLFHDRNDKIPVIKINLIKWIDKIGNNNILSSIKLLISIYNKHYNDKRLLNEKKTWKKMKKQCDKFNHDIYNNDIFELNSIDSISSVGSVSSVDSVSSVGDIDKKYFDSNYENYMNYYNELIYKLNDFMVKSCA